jgi:glycosyltransferase involved in cell wall biosynthesis
MSRALSVIVPVHNEAAVIATTARALLETLPEAAEVVFACNGCTDGSASIVRELGDPRVRVLEIKEAGKARAIREAERLVTAFPRFYVDSDVVAKGYVLLKLAKDLSLHDLDLVAPRIEFDNSGSSWAARAVNSIWLALPHGSTGGFHHVLGVSERGRRRWSEMPDVIADDAFIEAHIAADKKMIVRDVAITTRPPRSLWSFLRVRERWLRGDRELKCRGIAPPKMEGQRRAITVLARQPGQMLPVLLYVGARLIAQGLSMLPRGRGSTWYRDATSR